MPLIKRPRPSLSKLVIDANKDWGKYNITNFGSGGIDLYNTVTAHASRHAFGGPDQVPVEYIYSIGSNPIPIVYHDAQKSHSNTTYTKVKTILITRLNPKSTTLRIYFEIYAGTTDQTAYGRIYKNGSAYGPEHSTTSQSYVAFTDDLTFSEGDSIELWTRSSYGFVFARNFRILGTLTATDPLGSIKS